VRRGKTKAPGRCAGPISPVPLGEVEIAHQRIDELESAMLSGRIAGAQLCMPGYVHRFVPGLYLREIVMPPGFFHTTKTHNSEHAFVVLSGAVWATTPGGEPTHYTAPFVGRTYPGTRRVLYAGDADFAPVECRWMTLHPLTPEEEALRVEGASEADLVAAVEARIMLRRELADGKTAFEVFRERVDEQVSEGDGVLYYLPQQEVE